MSRCRYEDFAESHGYPVERCPYERDAGVPFCWGHLQRVAWLVLERRRAIPRWAVWVVAFVLLSSICFPR